ncbi:MAG: DNA mismatch repair protein MutS [Firmicutes bacterium]|nr:DNA mismatch repair protein MutS [Bacillota bacterium]
MSAKLTPMMQQYYSIKAEYPECILLFRLGDFYEMFGEDAKLASKILDITLTSRDQGRSGKIPMCGVPYHAADSYIAKLVSSGYRVAICEQVEDPKEAKGVVRREVVRVISPGTVIDTNLLQDGVSNYLVSLCQERQGWGLAYLDISTGEFAVTQIESGEGYAKVQEELFRLQPSEIIYPEDSETLSQLAASGQQFASGKTTVYTGFRTYAFKPSKAREVLLRHFQVSSLEGYGCAHLPAAVAAAGALLSFVEETQKRTLSHINRLHTYSLAGYMPLDPATRRNLELTETIRGSGRQGTLLWTLDRTKTAIGGRTLRHWVESPLVSAEEINWRLSGVEELYSQPVLLAEVRQILSGICDLERLVSRISYGVVNARELKSLADSCRKFPEIKAKLSSLTSPALTQLNREMDSLEDIVALLDESIVDEPPIGLREGGLIKPGYSKELDELRTKAKEGKDWISSLQGRERERTGIKSLKVGFNKVFGYYLEVTKSNLDNVPDDYIRKQTLANAERFITPELKEWEAAVLGAEERIGELEYSLFVQIREKVNQQVGRIQTTSRALGVLDALASLAYVARENNYVKPVVDEGYRLEIIGGRHPVVEALEPSGTFVPNDTVMDEDSFFLLITGPNMAGKSTYLRQVALITLMAQIGSFVPASSAHIGVVDRIFTRVGAADDLATGQSTFMVEMNEVANIINHATRRSLIILDEVGRGTSTFDGLSIAWAISEYLLAPQHIGAKTLFATHYHELTQLSETHQGITNLSVAVRREAGRIIFLRKVIPGAADKSYGIEVARLAGLPEEIINRAQQVLAKLESDGPQGEPLSQLLGGVNKNQLSLFMPISEKPDPIREELERLELDQMTPREALNKLYEWKERGETGG